MSTSILQKIKKYKIKEIQNLKDNFGIVDFEKKSLKSPPPLGFFNKLKKNPAPNINIIAEIKKASPSKGIICKDFFPTDIARSYEKFGASCLSILTDYPSFQGKKEDLIAVRKISNLPILMGVLNLTPNSFSDGGRYIRQNQGFYHAKKLQRLFDC